VGVPGFDPAPVDGRRQRVLGTSLISGMWLGSWLQGPRLLQLLPADGRARLHPLRKVIPISLRSGSECERILIRKEDEDSFRTAGSNGRVLDA